MAAGDPIELDGPWRLAPLDTRLQREGADPDLDDTDWPAIDAPGHWAEHPVFADHPGPILHRTRFTIDERATGDPDPDTRWWLTFDGVIADADVWLDGGYRGSTRGYFLPHRFEVTEEIRARPDHSLAVEIACPGDDRERAHRSFTGSLRLGPLAPPPSPGGLWRPVRVVPTGRIAVIHRRLLCMRADADRAELQLRLVLDAATAEFARVVTRVHGPSGELVAESSAEHPVAAGENQLEWRIDIDAPERWWPRALGPAPRYAVDVEVLDGDGRRSATTSWTTGLRTVSLRDLRWEVNGERVFVKGIVVGPQSPTPGSIDADAVRADVASAVAAGLDLVRMHGHVARPEFYDAADAAGLLVWQDLPVVGSVALNGRDTAQRIARGTVDVLGHHPSVAVWCAHEEPNGAPVPPPGDRWSFRRLARHVAPSWNRSVLDPLLRRVLRTADPSRPVIQRSGSLPGIGTRTASDPHLWLGWRGGEVADLEPLAESWPRLVDFLGGFGSQSAAIPEPSASDATVPNGPAWPTAERDAFDRYLPREAYPDDRSWAAATQAYQADLVRRQIDAVRRLKYRPCGGFCLTALFDPEPAGGFGVLDAERRPKAAWSALLDACRPVTVVIDRLPGTVGPGEEIALAVHAVSDLRRPIDDLVVVAGARIAGADGSGRIDHPDPVDDHVLVEHRWVGDLPADACVRIGTVELVVPPRHGVLVVDVHLDGADLVATQRTSTVIIPAAETGPT